MGAIQRPRRVYVAAPIFNKQQLDVVRDIVTMLRLLDFDYFSPYEASREIWKGRAPKDCSKEERDEVLKGNIDNLHTCEVLIAWVGGTEDGRTDTGVVWEMGYFNALKDYCLYTKSETVRFTLAYVVPTDKRQSMNLMLAGTVDAVAYGPAQLHRAMDIMRRGNHRLDDVRSLLNPESNMLHEAEQIS